MANATLTQALIALDGNWKSFADGVANGSYTFWLGSAISRDRFPPLKELLKIFLEKLYDLRDTAVSDCDCRRRLRDILGMVDSHGLDPAVRADAWDAAKRDDFLSKLTQHYSVVLDERVTVGGNQLDPRWDILDLPKRYADPTVPPDAEHRFLALLISEGAAREMVTTNWDALVETAFSACHRGGGAGLHVVACNDELAAPPNGSAATLYKIHGCARKSEFLATKYRPFMMATESDITSWNDLQRFAPLREAARTMLRQYPAAFIGLSIQDANLQSQILHAGIEVDPPPRNPPRVLFTVDTLTDDQKRALRRIYTDNVYWAERQQIEDTARMTLYAKPLLGGLYVRTIFKKVELLLNAGAGQMTNEQLNLVVQFLSAVKTSICQTYDPIADPSARWRALADSIPSQLALFLRLYRKQTGLLDANEYEAICSQSCGQLHGDPNLSFIEFHRLLLGLSLLWEGATRGLWMVTAQTDATGQSGQLIIERRGKRRRLFVVMRGQVAISRLSINGLVDLTDPSDVTLLYPVEHQPQIRATMPSRILPAAASSAPTEIWLPDLLVGSQSIDDLLKELTMALV